jgi:putative OmpL-like beta-barrel porin-2
MKRQRSLLVVATLAIALPSVAPAQSPTPVATTATVASADSATNITPPPPPAPPPTPAPTLLNDIQADVFVSFGYTYNINRPTDRLNSLRLFDENANTFSVDVAELVLQKSVTKVGDAGFRVDLVAGGSIPQKTQSYGLSIGQSADLQQAVLSYIAPLGSGLRLDLGKFVTHLGAELIEGYDGYNDNYSRSFLFNYAIPLTHTGVKASYAVSSGLSAMVMVVNGWDNVRDNNSGKSFGGQLALTPVSPLTVYLNYLGGPEKTDTSGFTRHTFDVVATWKALQALTLGLNADYGTESGASLVEPGKSAIWKGVAGYARLDMTSKMALALRAETLRDEGGTRLGTGAATTVGEVTLTPTFKVSDRFVIRSDVRYDRANKDIFIERGGELKRNQTTVAANVIFVY